ncbi:MAG: pilus (MSHA type) biogenesis protein MshL, partial [Gammaproteobacteria bacterium]|nr:pilus (MSHA type) biogenesis protein MshL [Gammaproteobacteria bacterium]
EVDRGWLSGAAGARRAYWGGEVLGRGGGGGGGEGGGGTETGLTGSFTMNGSSAEETNPYRQLASVLEGIFNPAAGGGGGNGAVVSSSSLSAAPAASRMTAVELEADPAAVTDGGEAAQLVATRAEPIIANPGSYVLDRMSGTLYVRARPSVMYRLHRMVNRFKEVLNRQIHIEAKIFEVSLNDENRTGINWAHLKDQVVLGFGLTQTIGANGAALSPLTNAATIAVGGASNNTTTISPIGQSGFTATHSGQQWLGMVDLLRQFGDVRSVSNPSIRARHGQPSMISVGQSSSYVETIATNTTAGANTDTTTTTPTVNQVFDGLMIGVVPFIKDHDRISLSIHPIQSSVVPSSLSLQDVTGNGSMVTLPQVDLKEISTMLEMNSGDLVMLGGLIDESTETITQGVPFLSSIPVLGYLFRHDTELKRTRELVIMLRATTI